MGVLQRRLPNPASPTVRGQGQGRWLGLHGEEGNLIWGGGEEVLTGGGCSMVAHFGDGCMSALGQMRGRGSRVSGR
jgi:hypothetical protein